MLKQLMIRMNILCADHVKNADHVKTLFLTFGSHPVILHMLESLFSFLHFFHHLGSPLLFRQQLIPKSKSVTDEFGTVFSCPFHYLIFVDKLFS